MGRKENSRVLSKRRVVKLWHASDRCCYICGQYVQQNHMSVDHVYPKVMVGNPVFNYMPAHMDCNTVKDQRRPNRIEMQRWAKAYRKVYGKPDRRMWKLMQEHGYEKLSLDQCV